MSWNENFIEVDDEVAMAQRSSEDRGSNTGLGNFDVALINSKLERKNEKEVRNCTIIIICDCECKKGNNQNNSNYSFTILPIGMPHSADSMTRNWIDGHQFETTLKNCCSKTKVWIN